MENLPAYRFDESDDLRYVQNTSPGCLRLFVYALLVIVFLSIISLVL